MIIESLALKDFRNYELLDIEFDHGINVLWGDNAQGKTNILESVYMCAVSRSHRGSRDMEMIRFGCDESHLRCIFVRDGVRHRIDMHLKRGSSKGIAIDGRSIRRTGELFGMINVICFSPEDLSMIKNGPAERRHFIDIELCQLDKVYLHNISQYNKTVNQRNALLKQIPFDRSLTDTLDIWDMQLVSCGKNVIEERRRFTEKLSVIAQKIHDKLSGGREVLHIVYSPSVNEEEFEEKLFLHRELDLKMKTTGVGPHRDDIIFMVNDKDVRKYGSQGQMRTAALSLKLAEIEFVRQKMGDDPILLLDDVLSELDGFRQKDLLESISGIQTIVTCTGVEDFLNRNVRVDKMYQISSGTAEESKETER